jgi:hypothetical protein
MPLDLLSALSVAASILQLVDFSRQIISKSRDLYHSGSGVLQEHAETKTVTIRLKQMTRKLRGKVRQNANGNQGLYIVDDQARYYRLMDICEEYFKGSEELISYLGKLKVPASSENRPWKSFRQALKSVWSKPEIDAMKKRLEVLRAELDTNILDIMRFVAKIV